MIGFEELRVNAEYTITEVVAAKRVNRNSYTGYKTNKYSAKLIEKDDNRRELTFEINNDRVKIINYDLIGKSKRGIKSID